MNRLVHALEEVERLHGDRPALITEDQTLTWRDLFAEVDRLAHTLRSLGVQTGERIAVAEPNRIALPILILAALRLGVVAVLVSPRFPETTRAAMVKSLGARMLFGWDEEGPQDGRTAIQTAAPGDGSTDNVVGDGRQAGTILFTSGSSGLPQAVLHSADNHYFSALGSNEILPVGLGDRWLLSLPLYHVGGLGILCRCLLGGGAMVFERRGVDLADQIVQDTITHLSLVPTQLRRLLKHPDLERLRSSLKVVLLGGAPIPPDLLQQASGDGLPVYPTYGLTEMASQVATGSPADPRGLRILPNREAMIADDGTICVRGDTLFLGYLTPDGIECPLDAEGWFHTGDMGRIDPGRYLHVTGRKDNMFISGGENIYPETIEAALSGIDGIEEVVVVPVKDADFGHRPVAFLRYRADFNLSDAESELSEEAQFGFDHHSLSAELEKTLPRFMLPIAYYPWPNGYSPAGIKLDRSFFRDLAARLRRHRR